MTIKTINEDYQELLIAMKDWQHGLTETVNHIALRAKKGTGDFIWRAFLESIPESHRQHFTCSTCEKFVKRHGDFIVEDETVGRLVYAAWPLPTFLPEENFFQEFLKKIYSPVYFKSATSSFGVPLYYDYPGAAIITYGEPELNGFNHFSMQLYRKLCRDRQNFKTDKRSVESFNLDLSYFHDVEKIKKVITILNDTTGINFRSNLIHTFSRLVNLIKFYYHSPFKTKVKIIEDGYYHICNTAAGQLLKALLDSDLSTDSVSSSISFYNSMTDANTYQLSTTDPTDVEIELAEIELMELGYGKSLARSIATLDQLPEERILWQQLPEEEEETSLFAAIKTQKAESNLPVTTGEVKSFSGIEKFSTYMKELNDHQRNDGIAKVELMMVDPGAYTVITKNTVEDCLPIIKHDSHWGWMIQSGRQEGKMYRKVKNLFTLQENQSQWDNDYRGVMGVPAEEPVANALRGLKFTDSLLRAELLNDKLYKFRKVIDKYSAKTPITVPEDGELCIGFSVQPERIMQDSKKNLFWNALFIVVITEKDMIKHIPIIFS